MTNIPGPKPIGTGIAKAHSLALETAGCREREQAKKLWDRYHATAEERQASRKVKRAFLPSPETVRRWVSKYC